MRKILLVDDDSAYTWCLQKYLQNRGYRMKTANTLEEARIAIKEEYAGLQLTEGQHPSFL